MTKPDKAIDALARQLQKIQTKYEDSQALARRNCHTLIAMLNQYAPFGEIAYRSGVPLTTISKIYNGKTDPDIQTFLKLHHCLNDFRSKHKEQLRQCSLHLECLNTVRKFISNHACVVDKNNSVISDTRLLRDSQFRLVNGLRYLSLIHI